MLIRRIMSVVPPPIRGVIRPVRMNLGAGLVDLGNTLRGEWSSELVPPRSKVFGGSLDYTAKGFEFLHYFTQYGGLKPHENVLDIGCGIGRMARPLTRYLTSGTYTGMDVMPDGLGWCVENISEKYPNFTFQRIDVFNEYYNPDSKVNAEEYRFPFPDGSFDFIFLTSVFTHLLKPDVERYISEISRLLSDRGRLFSTWFLLNEDVMKAIREDKSIPQITQSIGYDEIALVLDYKQPERQIGFSERYVAELFRENNLNLQTPINYGNWCPIQGRNAFHRQDILIASK